MKWAELKRAVEQAGVGDEDEIIAIECEMHHGGGSLQKVHQGNYIRLVEVLDQTTIDESAKASVS
ncbi:MAG TPA: hypothetical protein VD886_13735 [Herpetosiphonaceae bacterium]|nr:hypothetical protein [Herpetosiphonaceae bacterium]